MHPLLLSAAAIVVWQALWCIVALWKQRNDLADLAWGLGIAGVFVLAAWSTPSPRAVLLMGVVAVWGLRLAWHIAQRLARTEEDPRYRTWRAEWGPRAGLRTIFQVFFLQGVLQWVVSLPAIGHGAAALSWIDGIGVGVFLAGLWFEASADAQLARFLRSRTNPEAVLDQGLWALSRHPNYFGEALLWWGIGIIALAGGGAWWVLIGPIAVTILVRFVSGVPLAEARSMRKEAFRAYALRTPIFVPVRMKRLASKK